MSKGDKFKYAQEMTGDESFVSLPVQGRVHDLDMTLGQVVTVDDIWDHGDLILVWQDGDRPLRVHMPQDFFNNHFEAA